MANRYFRWDGEHPSPDMPVTIYYEVDGDGDVPRQICRYGDGRVRCVSVADYDDRPHLLVGIGSLVEGSFLDAIDAIEIGVRMEWGPGDSSTLWESDAETFEDLWQVHRA